MMTARGERKRKIIETLSKCNDISDAEQHYSKLCQIKKIFENDEKKRLFGTILEALGSFDRLLLLDTIKDRDVCVCELEAISDKAQASVSHHLHVLESAGLIKGWKKGKFTHYSLVKPIFQQFLTDFTAWIQSTHNWLGL